MRYLNLTSPVKLIAACLLCVISLSAFGQDKIKTIGNKPRTGSSNNSFAVIKGYLVGIEMNAGKKQVQLMKLRFHTSNHASDSVAFKVNVYQMAGKYPNTANLVTGEVKGFIKKYTTEGVQLNTIDLAPYNIKVAGNIVVAIEFLETRSGSNISFASGVLNGGTFCKSPDSENWKKIPIVGVDFSVDVKKLN